MCAATAGDGGVSPLLMMAICPFMPHFMPSCVCVCVCVLVVLLVGGWRVRACACACACVRVSDTERVCTCARARVRARRAHVPCSSLRILELTTPLDSETRAGDGTVMRVRVWVCVCARACGSVVAADFLALMVPFNLRW